MADEHIVINTDERFTIDPETRTITQMSGKTKLMQGDHNSECFEFEMPRRIDSHDMSLCNKVQINYINVSSDRSGQSKGPYLVADLRIDPNDDEKIVFSWLISRNATVYAGTLNFNITFKCLTGSIVDYAWSTDVFTGIKISMGIDNDSEEVVEEYTDILEQWKQEVLEGQIVDDALSKTSVNPIQNKVVAEEFERISYEVANKQPKGDYALKSDIPEISDLPESVLYTAQELTAVQQAQARENIGAASVDDVQANTGGKTVVGVIDSHYYNFRMLNEERGATMNEIREAALSEDKDIVIRLDLDNWQGTLQYLGLVNLTDDGSTYMQALLFSTIKMNNGVVNTSDNIVSGTVQLEYWYTTLESGTIMPPTAFMNCQFAEINLAPGAKHAGSFMRVNEDGLWDVEKVDIVQAPATATVGQTLVVKTVDDNGKPIEWETVDSVSSKDDTGSIILVDKVTGVTYSLEVINGTLTMTEVTE